MRLVVQIPPEEHESLPGYVLRLSEANGYPCSYLLGQLEDRQFPSKVGRLSAVNLIELAGLTDTQARRLSMIGERGTPMKLLDKPLQPGDCRTSAPQVCPLCLAEDPVCHALWDLAFVSTCPTHNVGLISQCAACNRPLRWTRHYVTRCSCGADLLVQRSAHTPTGSELTLARVFRQKLLPDSHRSPKGMDHLAALDLCGLSRLTWVLASVITDPWSEGKLVRSRQALSSHLANVAEILSDWPQGFQSFLRSTYGSKWEESIDIPRFDRVFRWALDRLESNFDERRSQIRFVVEEVYRFGAQHWCRRKLGAAIGYEHVLPKQFRWGTLLEAAKITGLQMGTLRKYINAGDVPIRRTLESKRSRSVMVSLDWARARKRSSQSLGLRSAARHVGLPIQTLKAIRTHGDIYHVRFQPHLRKSFSVEDLDNLKSRVMRNARLLRSIPKGSVSLMTVFSVTKNWSTLHKVEVVTALIDGRLIAIGRIGDGISDLIVPMSQLDAIWREVTGPQVDTITYPEAMAELCTVYEKIRGLVELNYLEAKWEMGRPRITTASFNSFRSRYTLLSALAGLRTRAVANLAMRRCVKLEVIQLKRNKCWLVPATSLSSIQSLCRSTA